MKLFFDADKSRFPGWFQLHDIDRGWFPFVASNEPRGGPLYYASLCGFYDLAKHLAAVEHPENVNARGGQMMSPLEATLYWNHFQVAELRLRMVGMWPRRSWLNPTASANIE
jgi:hypothetical protein